MNRRYLLIVCVMMLLLSGCATGVTNLKITQKGYSVSEKSLVFGGVYFEQGGNVSYTLFFHDVASKKEYQVLVAYGGLRKRTDFERRSFVIELPPGEYQITRIVFNELSWGMYAWQCDVNVRFFVPFLSLQSQVPNLPKSICSALS